MSRRSVAVLDVQSTAVTVVIGERGVNNTFVFKGIHSETYDGFSDAAFFDLKSLQDAINISLEEAERSCGEAIREILTEGGRTPAQGALGWLWARSDRTIPIPGFKTPKQIQDNARAMEFGPLTEKQMSEISRLLSQMA